METHVKERLTGALILVALLVVVVPEMLSGPAPRATGSAAVTEADGPPLRTYSMELGAPSAGAVADQSALAPQTTPPRVEEKPAPAPVQQQAAIPETVNDTATPPPTPPVVAAAGSRWWVQVGSFSQSANAGRFTRQLSESGFPAVVSSVQSNGKELFRVRAGPVADRAAAEGLRDRLAAAGHKGTLVAP